MKVKIPFNMWSICKLNAGVKSATSRSKKYGDSGDIFDVDGIEYRIMFVSRLPLWFVAAYLYETEGCTTEDEFIAVWTTIHRLKGYEPDDIVYYHFFATNNRKDSKQKTFELWDDVK